MAKAKKNKRKFKTAKAVLRNTLKYFERKPENWTSGTLRRRRASATEGTAFCALGGCRRFAKDKKAGDTAIRYLAEAMGMASAQTADIESVERYVYIRNDGSNGRIKILESLREAVA